MLDQKPKKCIYNIDEQAYKAKEEWNLLIADPNRYKKPKDESLQEWENKKKIIYKIKKDSVGYFFTYDKDNSIFLEFKYKYENDDWILSCSYGGDIYVTNSSDYALCVCSERFNENNWLFYFQYIYELELICNPCVALLDLQGLQVECGDEELKISYWRPSFLHSATLIFKKLYS